MYIMNTLSYVYIYKYVYAYTCSINRRKDGSLGGMVVEKCKFLQESGCKGKHRSCPTIIHHIEYYIYVCVIYPTYTCISHNPLSK